MTDVQNTDAGADSPADTTQLAAEQDAAAAALVEDVGRMVKLLPEEADAAPVDAAPAAPTVVDDPQSSPQAEPLTMTAGYKLFGPEADRYKSVFEQMGVNWEAHIGPKELVFNTAEEELAKAIADLTGKWPVQMADTLRAALAVTHEVEKVRSTMLGFLQHGFIQAQAQEMTISTLSGIGETMTNFVGASVRMCAAFLQIPEKRLVEEIYPEYNAITKRKRDLFVFLQRLNQQLMVDMRTFAEKAVAEQRLSATDELALPPELKVH